MNPANIPGTARATTSASSSGDELNLRNDTNRIKIRASEGASAQSDRIARERDSSISAKNHPPPKRPLAASTSPANSPQKRRKVDRVILTEVIDLSFSDDEHENTSNGAASSLESAHPQNGRAHSTATIGTSKRLASHQIVQPPVKNLNSANANGHASSSPTSKAPGSSPLAQRTKGSNPVNASTSSQVANTPSTKIPNGSSASSSQGRDDRGHASGFGQYATPIHKSMLVQAKAIVESIVQTSAESERPRAAGDTPSSNGGSTVDLSERLQSPRTPISSRPATASSSSSKNGSLVSSGPETAKVRGTAATSPAGGKAAPSPRTPGSDKKTHLASTTTSAGPSVAAVKVSTSKVTFGGDKQIDVVMPYPRSNGISKGSPSIASAKDIPAGAKETTTTSLIAEARNNGHSTNVRKLMPRPPTGDSPSLSPGTPVRNGTSPTAVQLPKTSGTVKSKTPSQGTTPVTRPALASPSPSVNGTPQTKERGALTTTQGALPSGTNPTPLVTSRPESSVRSTVKIGSQPNPTSLLPQASPPVKSASVSRPTATSLVPATGVGSATKSQAPDTPGPHTPASPRIPAEGRSREPASSDSSLSGRDVNAPATLKSTTSPIVFRSIKSTAARSKSRLNVSYIPSASPISPSTPPADVLSPSSATVSVARSVELPLTSVWTSRPRLPFNSQSINVTAGCDTNVRSDDLFSRKAVSLTTRIFEDDRKAAQGQYNLDEAHMPVFERSCYNPEYLLSARYFAFTARKLSHFGYPFSPRIVKRRLPFLKRNLRAGLDKITASLVPDLPRSKETADRVADYEARYSRNQAETQGAHAARLETLLSDREVEELGSHSRIPRELVFDEAYELDVSCYTGGGIERIGCTDMLSVPLAFGVFLIDGLGSPFGIHPAKIDRKKPASTPRSYKLRHFCPFRIEAQDWHRSLHRITVITLSSGTMVTDVIRGRENWEWRLKEYPRLEKGSNEVDLIFEPDPARPGPEDGLLIIRCRISVKFDYSRSMSRIPRPLKPERRRTTDNLSIAYLSASTPDEVRSAATMLGAERVVDGAVCAFCALGDLGSEEALYVHYEIAHADDVRVDCIGRELDVTTGNVKIRLLIRHGEARTMVFPEPPPPPASIPPSYLSDAVVEEAALREEGLPVDAVNMDIDASVDDAPVDDAPVDDAPVDVDMGEQMEESEVVGKDVGAITSVPLHNLTEHVARANTNDGVQSSVASIVDTDERSTTGTSDAGATSSLAGRQSKQSNSASAPQTVKDVLYRLPPKFQGPFRHTDKIMLENRLGKMQPYMASRRNKYTEWSSRVVPETPLDLLPELDKLYDGGQLRFYMRKIEDDFIIGRHHIAERRQLFMIVWNRWRQEKGSIVDAADDVEYLTAWLDKYGDILRRANADRETREHLLMLKQDKLICNDAFLRACKHLNELMGIKVAGE